MTKRQIKIISIIILSVVSLLYGLLAKDDPQGKSSERNFVRVERVSDGDTITARVEGRSEKIRLIGMDAPELGQRPWGKKAKKHLEAFIASSSWNVIPEYDIDKRDKYGRLLAYLRANDGRLINAEMLRDGYAVLFTFPPNVRHVNELTEAQRQAREQRLGIWGRNGLKQAPVDYRKEHPRLR